MPVAGSSITSATGSTGASTFHDVTGFTPTAGVEVDVISITVPGGETRRIVSLFATCRQSGVFRVKIDASIVGTARTGPGKANIELRWPVNRDVTAGQIYKVTFEQCPSRPTSDVDAHLSVLSF